jgi:nucleoside phosphorylase
MLGMCCGFEIPKCAHPQKLGNVIISREIALWDEMKYQQATNTRKSEEKDRSKTRMVDDRIREDVWQIVETRGAAIKTALGQEKRKVVWRDIVERYEGQMRPVPEVGYFATVSGSSLVADEAKVRKILNRHKKAVGLEMENYAVYTAVDLVTGLKPSKLAIKGVADYGDGHKKDDVQKLASTYSVITFLKVLEGLIERGKIG